MSSGTHELARQVAADRGGGEVARRGEVDGEIVGEPAGVVGLDEEEGGRRARGCRRARRGRPAWRRVRTAGTPARPWAPPGGRGSGSRVPARPRPASVVAWTFGGTGVTGASGATGATGATGGSGPWAANAPAASRRSGAKPRGRKTELRMGSPRLSGRPGSSRTPRCRSKVSLRRRLGRSFLRRRLFRGRS